MSFIINLLIAIIFSDVQVYEVLVIMNSVADMISSIIEVALGFIVIRKEINKKKDS